MSNIYCAPDLPFTQTVIWYFKQVGGVMIISLTALLLLYVLFVTYHIYADIKDYFKRKMK